MIFVLALACGDDEGPNDAGTDGGNDARVLDAADDVGADTNDGGNDSTRFILRIENASGGGPIPSPISPGVVLASSAAAPLFTEDQPDREEGLVALAEDGDPAELSDSLLSAVVFDTPMGAATPGLAFPGDAYEIEFDANAGDALSFASMLVESNDLFLAPAGTIGLFDAEGSPLPDRDVTGMTRLWDVGSEANEAPGAGPNQAPRQANANAGSREGVVREFSGTLHALPTPGRLISVDVSEAGGTYTFTLTNVSPVTGTFLSPISAVAWAVHDDAFHLFEPGDSASAALESLAERW